MEKTIKLYYENAYIQEFEATIQSITPIKNNLYEIVLDATAFFPESGGQVADRGTLLSGRVEDVRIKNDVIIHKVGFDEPVSYKAGDRVFGKLDWDFRFSNMQNHTGEHIFSGIVKEKYGYENIGFHLSENTVTMDYSGKLTDAQIKELEWLANKAIFSNQPITATFPDRDTLKNLSCRSKLDIDTIEDVRIVTIKDIDICACCAPHLSNTSEVGILKVISNINYKGGTRLNILCGARALGDYISKHDILTSIGHDFSVSYADVPDAVEKQKNENIQFKERIKSLEENILDNTFSMINPDLPLVFTDISDNNLLRNKANTLAEKSKDVVVAFNGSDTKGYSLILLSTKTDVHLFFNLLSEQINIKGGGSSQMIQGKTPEKKADILRALYEINPDYASSPA